MTQLGFAWEIIINVVESNLFMLLLVSRLHFKKSIGRGVLVGTLSRTFIVSAINFTTDSTTVTICLAALYNIVLSVCISDNKLFDKIVWGSSFALVCAVADKTTFWVASAWTGYPLTDLLVLGSVRIYMSCAYLLLCAALVFFLAHLRKKEFFLPKRFQIILLFLIGLGAFAMEQILEITILADTQYMDDGLTGSIQVVGYLILALLAGFLGFVEYLGTVSQQNETLRRMALEHELERKHYSAMDTAVPALREWKHDYKNHLQVMLAIAREQRCDALARYITGLENGLNQGTPSIATGNRILDAVLSAKLMEFSKNKVRFSYEIYLPSALPLEGSEFTSLIGNLLDNAIEACVKWKGEEAPSAKLIMKPYHDMLYISLENCSDGSYAYSPDGSLESTKPGENHGFGIKKIQNIAASKGGFSKLYPEATTFKTVIMLPIETAEGDEADGAKGRNC